VADALLQRASRTPLFTEAIRLLERIPEPPGRLRVLTYHRVDRPEERPFLNPGLISASPEEFERQILLLASDYHPVSIEAVLQAFRSAAPLPRRAVLVTFDDAYLDFAEHAWPILRAHAVPAVLFVPTAYPGIQGAAFWADRLYHALRSTHLDRVHGLDLRTPAQRQHAYCTLKSRLKLLAHSKSQELFRRLLEELGSPQMPSSILDWDALRRLAAQGLSLAPHTRTHALLSRVTTEAALEEAVESRRDLEREIGRVPPVFAYPSGEYTAAVAAGLDACGFELAFTTAPGINAISSADPMRIRRFNVGRRTTVSILRARLLAGCR
jgi:peptidoglycan/xylan/chitin deacetylase (PgdA/CDA1 family)